MTFDYDIIDINSNHPPLSLPPFASYFSRNVINGIEARGKEMGILFDAVHIC